VHLSDCNFVVQRLLLGLGVLTSQLRCYVHSVVCHTCVGLRFDMPLIKRILIDWLIHCWIWSSTDLTCSSDTRLSDDAPVHQVLRCQTDIYLCLYYLMQARRRACHCVHNYVVNDALIKLDVYCQDALMHLCNPSIMSPCKPSPASQTRLLDC